MWTDKQTRIMLELVNSHDNGNFAKRLYSNDSNRHKDWKTLNR